MGVYLISINPKKAVNKIFFLLSLGLAIWALSDAFTYNASTKDAAFIWHKIGSIGWTFAPAFFLHFFILLSEKKLRYLGGGNIILIYIPSLFFFYYEVGIGFMLQDFVLEAYGWREIINKKGFMPYVFDIYYLTYLSYGFWVVYRWGKDSKSKRKMAQAKMILATGIITLAGVVVSDRILPIIEVLKAPSFSSIFLMVMLFGIFYSVVKYKLMVLTPNSVMPLIISHMKDLMILVDRSKTILYVNTAAENLLSRHSESLIGKNIMEILSKGYFDKLFDERSTPGSESMEITYKLSNEEVVLNASVSTIYDDFGDVIGYAIFMFNVTELKRAEKRLQYMATHDNLTNLPSRVLLYDRLKNALARAKRYNHMVGVLLIDIDNFKEVNDRFGHFGGDILLQEIAKRLKHSVRESDTVARLGGDEFVVVLTDIEEASNLPSIASRVVNSINQPVFIGNEKLIITASIGIAVFPNDGEDSETLLKNADMAMYRVKKDEKNGYQFYSDAVGGEYFRVYQFKNDLYDAVRNSEFVLYYQPIVDLGSGEVSSLEALIRWKHPERGLIQPLDFLPIAEKTGQIINIGKWVLNTAIWHIKQWREEGLEVLPVSLNFSLKQFLHSEFIDDIKLAIERFGISPKLLQIEITESTAIKDIERSGEIIKELDKMGIRVIIDDFGTGYSSLHWLKKLPIYALKIDKFFIREIGDDADEVAIVAGIISLAHGLGMRVIAEGVETKKQLEILRKLPGRKNIPLKCDLAQGYFITLPLPADEIIQFLRENKVFNFA